MPGFVYQIIVIVFLIVLTSLAIIVSAKDAIVGVANAYIQLKR